MRGSFYRQTDARIKLFFFAAPDITNDDGRTLIRRASQGCGDLPEPRPAVRTVHAATVGADRRVAAPQLEKKERKRQAFAKSQSPGDAK